MSSEDIKKAKADGYQRGYRAGKKVVTDKAYQEGLDAGKKLAYNQSRYDQFFCAALTGLLSGGKKYSVDALKGAENNIAVAKWFADEAMRKVRQ